MKWFQPLIYILQDVFLSRLYKLTGAVNPAVKMQLGLAISFVEFTEQPKQGIDQLNYFYLFQSFHYRYIL